MLMEDNIRGSALDSIGLGGEILKKVDRRAIPRPGQTLPVVHFACNPLL